MDYQEHIVPGSAKIIWTGKGKLYLLVDILYQNNYIKSKREMFSFFIKPCSGRKTRWNADFKYLLAYLLFILYTENHIIITGNKGFFTCAENHFIDFDGNSFKKHSLKNIKLKIVNNPNRYSYITIEVDDIIKKIINP
jgi:hypothetical protein